jgi:hypothetical protein
MAGQFELAHSQLVIGAGIVAGGPYGCAESVFADVMPGPGTALLNVSKAVNGCMRDSLLALGLPDPNALAARARQLANQGRIDPIDGVLRDRVYLFAGSKDTVVVPNIVRAAAEFYTDLGLAPANIQFVTDVAAGHGFVTLSKGDSCASSDSQTHILACGYDSAGALLAHIYGPLTGRAATASGETLAFDQREFTRGLSDHGLADKGIAYVPRDCRATPGCRVHVVFHGCSQNQDAIGERLARDAGYAEWADTNRLIVLFPQVTAGTLNPYGCWDWWGYTGRGYLTRNGPQIVAVRRMLERLGQTGSAPKGQH